MSRMDLVILKRLGSRIALTVLVLFGLIALAESLDTWRFGYLAAIGGIPLAVLAIVTGALRWTLQTLPVTLLVGGIVGLLDLQARREMTVIRAAGVSVWRTLMVPLGAVVVLAGVVSLVGDTVIVHLSRGLAISMPQPETSGLWVEETGSAQDYVMVAQHPHPGGLVLEDVTVFFSDPAANGSRIDTQRVEFTDDGWRIAEGTRFDAESGASPERDVVLPTTKTAGDMNARLASPSEQTVFELWDVLAKGITDPDLRAAAQMRLLRLLALPLVLMGSLLIAFAFTTGYRRTNKYGTAVLYGLVLGFVVYVVTEMAAMAGAAGVLEPMFAAVAPAIVAIVIGTTVLLYKEDGRI